MQLSFSPDAQLAQANEIVTVDILTDTQGIDIDGIDIDLPFTGLQFISLTPGKLMPSNHQVISTNKILFGQNCVPPNKFNGKGVLCTLSFKVLASTKLVFNLTPGATNETNMVADGKDILTDVGNAQILMATTVINKVTYPLVAQPLKTNAVPIADGENILLVKVKLCTSADPTIWPDKSQHVNFYTMSSIDGGVKWLHLTSFTSHGGIHFNAEGQEIPECVIPCIIDPLDPFYSATNRLVRTSMAVLDGTPPDLTLSVQTFKTL